ncbi:hypothetical protein [Treponema zioleckii]|uniref:hypothetical protein n=1 Tax=Treponema zioleckii TaxID=331680 RepID=UPI00168B8FC9|nr:hypothetical protein [Treponema zioleckii]
MKRRPITLTAAISIILFLLAIIYLIAGIYIEQKDGPQKAKRRFDTLMNSTKQAALITPIGSTDFCNRFIDAIGNIGDFSTLEMRINEKLVYSYPPREYSKPSPELVNNFSRTEYANDNSINLIASIYLMKPDTIYNHAKVSFFLVLLGTVISVLLLVIFKEEPKEGFEPVYDLKTDEKSNKKNRRTKRFSPKRN